MKWNRFLRGGRTRLGGPKLVGGMVLVVVLLVVTVSTGLALASIIDLSKSNTNIIVRGAVADAYMGEVTGSGDFNGDGYADLLLGSGGHDRNGKFSGAAYMIPGGSSMASVFDLKMAPATLEIYGQATNNALGHAVAGGDLNGDGLADIIVTADAWSNEMGAVYVILGKTQGLSGVIDFAAGGAANLTIAGANAGDRFGRSVASGDVNGDGIDDLLVGAYTAMPNGRIEAGAVYIFLGGANLFASPNLTAQNARLIILGPEGDLDGTLVASGRNLSGPQAAADTLFYDAMKPEETGEFGSRLGRSVAAGDVNGDAVDDIIAGAYGTNVGASKDAGKTFIIFGNAGIFDGRTIDLATTPANLTLSGVAANDQAGFTVASGRLNADAIGDIVVGAYTSSGEAGKVYVVYGNGSLPGEISLANANVVISGFAGGDRLGRSIATGDVNKDGIQDLIVGASRADPGGRSLAGEAYLFFGGTLRPASSPNNAYVSVLGQAGGGQCDSVAEAASKDCGDEAGHSVATGDFNGDGFADIVVGALYNNNGNSQDAGAVYVINGASSVAEPGITKMQLFLPSVTYLKSLP